MGAQKHVLKKKKNKINSGNYPDYHKKKNFLKVFNLLQLKTPSTANVERRFPDSLNKTKKCVDLKIIKQNNAINVY